MSSIKEEQEKKKISIRPNGKIRPIPKNTEAELSYNVINPGNTMINFQNEYLHQRHYKDETVKKLLETGALNPFTRVPIQQSNLQPYLASINGDVGGKTIENLSEPLIEDYTTVLVKYIRPPLFSQSTFYGFSLTPVYQGITPVQQNDMIYSKNDTIGRVLRHYTKVRNLHEHPAEILIKTFGIRDTPDSYLISPFYKVKKDNVLITDYSQPLSTFIEPHTTVVFSVEASTVNIIRDVFASSIVEGLELPANVNPRVRGFWFSLQSDAYSKAKSLFLTWLGENNDEAYYYMNGTFTENTLKKGSEIRDIVRKRTAETVEKLSKMYGGKRKTRRFSKSSRQYRKKTLSK